MALNSGLFMPTATGRMQGIAEMAASHVPYDSLSDAEVMLRAGTDDNAAYEHLVTKFHRPMIAFMYRMFHNQALAEELAQEVFLRVYRSRKTYAAEAKFTTWLYRIALNLARNRYWYFFRRRRHNWVSLERPLGDDSQATFADMVAAQDHDPAQETVASEFSALVAACMERLDHKHREILTMRNVLDLSYEQIAQSLGINVGTVKSRIARARENLRTLLTEANPELEPALSVADFFLITRTGYGAPAVSYA